MEKRLLLSTVLSIIIITLWYILMPKQQNVQPPDKKNQEITKKAEKNAAEPKSFNTSSGLPANISTEDYVIETNSVKVIFNNLGARIKHWYVKEGNNPIKWPDLALQSNGKYLDTYPDLLFKVANRSENSIAFYGTTGGLKISKTYQLSEDGLNKLIVEITNTSSRNEPFEIYWGPGIGSDLKNMKEEKSISRVVAIKKMNSGYTLTKIKNSSIDPKEYIWAGIDNRYFATVVSCAQFDSINVNKGTEKGLFELTFSANDSIKGNSKTSFDIDFYTGVKSYDKLKKLNSGLEETIDFGFFKPLSKFAFVSLKFFYKLTHNYGMSIIIITIILQIVLYPLSIKSFQASKAMKTLQPKMKELQEKYKNDPKRLNVETMNLYKTQKTNPLGGCLPMIAQLPIFWALFTTLRNIYELRGAPFVWWIKDLSTPDLLFTIGQLPIRILPLLMGVTMFLQQKLSGMSADPSQKSLAYIMPVIFTFMFWNFPAGLVLYWLVNSILTLMSQSIMLNKRSE